MAQKQEQITYGIFQQRSNRTADSRGRTWCMS